MKKITRKKQSEIFEKTIRQQGRIFRVRFIILEKEGKLRGRVISCEPIEALRGESGVGVERYLPLPSRAKAVPQETISFLGIVSPFFSKLEFLTSIMVRAPAH